MTSNIVRRNLSFRTRSTLCVVCRTLLLCLCLCLPLLLLLLLPLPLPLFFLCNVDYFRLVWLFRVTSEVIHNPTLVRVQVRLFARCLL